MKINIDNKRYDTETAKKVAEYRAHNKGGSSFTQALYRKKTGEYFLYAKSDSGSGVDKDIEVWGDMERVIPYPYDTAKMWAKRYLPEVEYRQLFGKVEADTASVMLTLKVKRDAAKLLDRKHSETGKTKSELVGELIVGAYR